MTICCSDEECKYRKGDGYYGLCKHPGLNSDSNYGGIDRILRETCKAKEKEKKDE